MVFTFFLSFFLSYFLSSYRKFENVTMVRSEFLFQRRVAKPTFHSAVVLSENTALCRSIKTTCLLNSPIFIGYISRASELSRPTVSRSVRPTFFLLHSSMNKNYHSFLSPLKVRNPGPQQNANDFILLSPHDETVAYRDQPTDGLHERHGLVYFRSRVSRRLRA